MRAEPLVPGELEQPGLPHRVGAGRVGAEVGATLAFGHGHAAQRRPLRVRIEEPRLPLLRQVRRMPKCRNGGVRHREWTAHAGLGLRQQHEERASDHVRARTRVAPGERSPLRCPSATVRTTRGGIGSRPRGSRSGPASAGPAGCGQRSDRGGGPLRLRSRRTPTVAAGPKAPPPGRRPPAGRGPGRRGCSPGAGAAGWRGATGWGSPRGCLPRRWSGPSSTGAFRTPGGTRAAGPRRTGGRPAEAPPSLLPPAWLPEGR